MESVQGVQPKAAMRAGMPKMLSEGRGMWYDQIIKGRLIISVMRPKIKVEVTIPIAMVERSLCSSWVRLVLNR
jgi:hypothetical protein